MPQSDASPRPSWASREGLVIPRGPDGSDDTDRNVVRLNSLLQTLHRFGLALDEGNPAALADCLTQDVGMRATVAGEESLGVHSGVSEAFQWFQDLFLSGTEQQRLLITNAVLASRTVPREQVSFYFTVVRTSHGVVSVLATGVARAEVRLDRESWRISNLMLGFDSRVPPPDVQ